MSSTNPYAYRVLSLGCKVNQVEMESLTAQLKGRGFVEDSTESVATVIINSCTVTAAASKKTRKLIRRTLRTHPRARILVTGCAAVIEGTKLEAIDERVHVVPKDCVFDLVVRDRREPATPSKSAHPVCGSKRAVGSRIGPGFRTRVGIKIQDGCDNHCSYCLVRIARGPSRSMDYATIIGEAKSLVKQGVKELVLTGINLGAFQSPRGDLTTLLQDLLALGADHRLRLSSIEPRDLSPALLELMASSQGRICRHLHIPIQSGSDRVLHEMGRDYDRKFILELVTSARALMPSLALSTDMMVAFPGETEEDFLDTLDLATRARFSRIHGFRYSRRPGTRAADRLDQIPEAIARRRAQRLDALAARLRKEDLVERAGSVEAVLIEGAGCGMTESYRRLHFTDKPWKLGSLVSLTLPSQERDGEFFYE